MSATHMCFRPAHFICGFSLALAFLASSQGQSSVQDSPFAPIPGTGQPNDALPREKLELAGISVVGKKTLVCLYDTEKKQNRWVAVGETSSGVEVVSCDVKADRAVIRVGGQSKILSLRKAAVGTADPVSFTTFSPAPSAVPADATTTTAAPANATPLTEQQVQEREARMLVSDLLEIGMQQRKAYEAKKAAEEAAKKTAPTPPAKPASK